MAQAASSSQSSNTAATDLGDDWKESMNETDYTRILILQWFVTTDNYFFVDLPFVVTNGTLMCGADVFERYERQNELGNDLREA